jgi:hypothetical protein
LESRYLQLLEGFGLRGTQEDTLQGNEVRPHRR